MSQTDILTYVVILMLALVCYYLRTWFRCALVVSNLPGPPTVPILGHAHFATDYKTLRDLGSSCHRVYGSLMKVWLALYPTVLVVSPHCLQKILSSTKQTEKLFFYKLMDNFLGKGLVTSSGSTWRLHRKLLQPSFSQSVLEQFIPAFHDGSQRLVKRFQDHETAPVNITSHMNQVVLDILNDTILGIQADDTVHLKADENSPFRHAKVLIPYRIAHPWLMVSWIYESTEASKQENDHRRNLSDFTREIIRKRKAERESNEKANNNPQNGSQKTRISLLDRMLDISDNNPNFDEEAMIDEVCTFMLAGQESVATAMSFCLFLLARHQDALRKVRDEVHAIFGSSERAPSLQDLRQMYYLERCIKETLRLYPSIPLLGRRLSENVNMGKCTLPAGCGVLISPYATHRIAEIFPDPEKFDPDRFLPENVQNMHPYAYTAFSLGPRNCIGKAFAIMEMKTLLSAVVRRYHVTTVPGKEDIDLAYRITLRAKGGLWVQFSPRQAAAAQPS